MIPRSAHPGGFGSIWSVFVSAKTGDRLRSVAGFHNELRGCDVPPKI